MWQKATGYPQIPQGGLSSRNVLKKQAQKIKIDNPQQNMLGYSLLEPNAA